MHLQKLGTQQTKISTDYGYRDVYMSIEMIGARQSWPTPMWLLHMVSMLLSSDLAGSANCKQQRLSRLLLAVNEHHAA